MQCDATRENVPCKRNMKMNETEKKLKAILQNENEKNYADLSVFGMSPIISHRERMLARIESSVFGNTNIQKSEFKKIKVNKKPVTKLDSFTEGMQIWFKHKKYSTGIIRNVFYLQNKLMVEVENPKTCDYEKIVIAFGKVVKTKK